MPHWGERRDPSPDEIATLPAVARNDNEREQGTYYLKMDIKSFFTSIDQRILYELIAGKIKNQEILWLTKTIIFHDCAHDIPPKIQSQPSLFSKLPPDKSLFRVAKGKGLPIGNLTSQFFANIYLNELDLFVKHVLKARYYLRYVDDFVIIGSSYGELNQYRQIICEFVQNKLALRVHPDKQFIIPVGNGIDFVGYIIKPDYVLVRRRVVDNWRHGLKNADNALRKRQINSAYMGHAKWANAYCLSRKMILLAR